jgi:hypothetical protein
MANLHLVTGHAGEPHVKSTDDASLMQAIYGGDSVVLDRNDTFSYDVISNNIIRVYDGEALMQGRYIKMDKGNYVDLNIDNGHTGYRRIDVIAIEYTKDDKTNIEEANLVVVKGSETKQEQATVPELVDGDTVDGSASTNQMALYHVKIDGLSITDVTQAYTLGQDIQTIASAQINTIGAVTNGLVNVAKKSLDAFKQAIYKDDADVQTRTDLENLVNGLDDAGSYVFPPTQNGDGGVTPDTNAINRLKTRITTNENSIAAINVLVKAIDGTGAGFHSSIYRGKYLGDTYTDKQKQAIANGSFDDLFVGDYWTINGVNWRIADFDYYYNIGDTGFTKHHVVIVPDTILYNAQMNSTNITTGAYTGSEMYTANLDNARIMFDNAFGSSFIPTHRGLYANAVSDDKPSGWAWRDMRVELMNEEQVYGHAVFGTCNQNGYDVGTQRTQFKLFALDQTKINIGYYYWLTNAYPSTYFVIVHAYGFAFRDNASAASGVRPFACLVGA